MVSWLPQKYGPPPLTKSRSNCASRLGKTTAFKQRSTSSCISARQPPFGHVGTRIRPVPLVDVFSTRVLSRRCIVSF